MYEQLCVFQGKQEVWPGMNSLTVEPHSNMAQAEMVGRVE